MAGDVEDWRFVIDDIHEVSNMGRVRSPSKGIMKGGTTPKGYKTVKINKKTYYVHHLVLIAFVGPCPPGMECRHFPDNNRANNKLENLQWGTPKQNQADRIHNGTNNGFIKRDTAKGTRNSFAKLTEFVIPFIRNRIAEGCSDKEIASDYQVHPSTISLIRKRKTWRHV